MNKTDLSNPASMMNSLMANFVQGKPEAPKFLLTQTKSVYGGTEYTLLFHDPPTGIELNRAVNIFWGIVGPIWTQFVGVLKNAYDQLAPLGDVASKTFGDIATEGGKMAPIGEFLGNIVKAILNVAGNLVTVLVPIIQFVFPLFVDYIKGLVNGFIKLYNTIQYVFSGKLQSDITAWWTTLINSIYIVTGKHFGTAFDTGCLECERLS